MELLRLSVLNYKNIAAGEFSFSPRINCFVGRNGMGKTNLLDAIYYLSFCKSYTNPIDSQVIRHSAEFFVLQGDYRRGETSDSVYCCVKRGQKKQFKHNKVAYKHLAEHIGVVPLVIVSPSDASLIQGGSDERRRFMDMIISLYDREYLNALIHYNAALENRNRLLKTECKDALMYEVYEETLATCGTLIYARRNNFIQRFIPIFQHYYALLSNGSEKVELVYNSQLQEKDLTEALPSTRERDMLIGHTTHGIHKDDLEMLLNGYQIKRVGSQGQNKTFLLSLKFAQFDFLKEVNGGLPPILLLDDIFDKLDTSRVRNIIQLVSMDHFGQIFITDTNRERLSDILSQIGKESHIFTIEEGEIVQLEEV